MPAGHPIGDPQVVTAGGLRDSPEFAA